MQAKLHRWSNGDATARFDDLFNLVVDPAFMVMAWERVAHNAGARSAGVDGLTARAIEAESVPDFLAGLREQVKSGQFAPSPVREKLIPKSPGSYRRLGIPTIADRVVQACLVPVLEPIFEADFHPSSYGFRPRRRAWDAIAEIQMFSSRSYEWVLEGDIKACFDEIDHTALMGRVRARIGDKRVLALVKAFLKAGILSEDQVHRSSNTGTPQGGILTPPTQLQSGRVSPSESVLGLLCVPLLVLCRTGMECRMVILFGPTRTSLTSRRRTRCRSGTVAVVALSRSPVRKSCRLSASLR